MKTTAKGFYLLTLIMLAITNNGGELEDRLFELGHDYFYTIDRNHEFPWGIVQTVTQDSEGFMWFGTQSGTFRFDGYDFKKFNHSPNDPTHSLSGDDVYPSFTSSYGTTIFSTNNGVSIFNQDSQNFTNYSMELEGEYYIPENYVRAFAETKEGIIVATPSYLILLRPNEVKPILHPLSTIAGLEEEPLIRVAATDSKDRVWLGTDKGIYFSESSKLVFQNYDKSWQESITGTYIDSKHRIWLQTKESGLHYIDRSGRRHKFQSKVALWENRTSVQTVIDASEGELWILANNQQFYVFDVNTLRYLRKIEPNTYNSHSIKGYSVESIFKAQNGLIWLALSQSGIQIYDPTNVFAKQWYLKNEERDELIKIDQIEVTDDEKIWLGKTKLFMLDHKASSNFIEQKNLANKIDKLADLRNKRPPTLRLSAGPNNTLFIAFGSDNFFSYDISTQSLKKLTIKKSVSCPEEITEVDYFGNQLVWISCHNYNIIKYDLKSNVVQSYTLGENRNGYNPAPVLDSNDTLWVPTKRGLHYLTHSHDRHYKEVTLKQYPLLQDHRITSLLVDKNFMLMVDTTQGLYRININNISYPIENISEYFNQKPQQLFGNMAVDSLNRIWSDEGFLDMEKREFHRFSSNEGVPYGTNWLGAMAVTKGGLILLGHNDYLHMIWPEKHTQNRPDFKINQISSLIGQRPFPTVEQTYRLEPSPPRIDFKFAAQEYRNPNDIIYSYKLSPYEYDWNEADITSRSATYTNLGPGEYTLDVKAAVTTVGGVISTSSVKFKIDEAWHQTIWFYCALIAMTLGGLWLVVLWRTKRLRLNQKKLSAMVFERTEQLETSLTDLREMQTRLIQSEKQASLGRMVRGVAHELNTPIGVLKMATSMNWDSAVATLSAARDHAFTEKEYNQQSKKTQSTNELIEKNVTRLSDLVSSFKLIAPDDKDDTLKQVEVFQYLGKLCKQFPDQEIVIVDSGELELTTYQSSLGRVIEELVVNAGKHNKGREPEHALVVTVSYGYEASNEAGLPYWIRVKDNGVGMTPDAMDKAFDPFYTTIPDATAVGLGLHMAFNNVTQQMGGEINYESSQTIGASFLLRFPDIPH